MQPQASMFAGFAQIIIKVETFGQGEVELVINVLITFVGFKKDCSGGRYQYTYLKNKFIFYTANMTFLLEIYVYGMYYVVHYAGSKYLF